jgi:transposase
LHESAQYPYWRNLFTFLAAEGFSIALLNPLRARRFAEEDLARTKTDAIEALGIARFAAQKHPAATTLPEPAVEHLRELVRLREQTVLQLGDRVRHLHEAVDLTFPEFTHHVARSRHRTCHGHPLALSHRCGVAPGLAQETGDTWL